MTVADLDVAVRAAQLAAKVAASFAGADLDVRVKDRGSGDLVSRADVAAEAAVRDLLAADRPDDGVTGEEGTRRAGRRTWVIDPIDGTVNFVRGDPYWCSAVALLDGDVAVVSAVHEASTGRTYAAERGRGAWCQGRRLTVVGPGPALADALLATYVHPGDLAVAPYAALLGGCAGVRVRGSGTLDLVALAAGGVDVWVQRDVHPWDWHPGALIVAEAGGRCARSVGAAGVWSYAGAARVVADVAAVLAAHGDG